MTTPTSPASIVRGVPFYTDEGARAVRVECPFCADEHVHGFLSGPEYEFVSDDVFTLGVRHAPCGSDDAPRAYRIDIEEPDVEHVVEVIFGPHKGAVGFLDDETIGHPDKIEECNCEDCCSAESSGWPAAAIVYFEEPHETEYAVIPWEYLRVASTEVADEWRAEFMPELEADAPGRSQAGPETFAAFRSRVGACEACGWTPPDIDFSHGVLNVHHVVPRAAGGTNDESNLAVLCPTCHSTAHRVLMVVSAGKHFGPKDREELLDKLRRLIADPRAFRVQEKVYFEALFRVKGSKT